MFSSTPRRSERRELCALIGYGARLEETQNKGLAINFAQMTSKKANQKLHKHKANQKKTLAENSRLQTLETPETEPQRSKQEGRRGCKQAEQRLCFCPSGMSSLRGTSTRLPRRFKQRFTGSQIAQKNVLTSHSWRLGNSKLHSADAVRRVGFDPVGLPTADSMQRWLSFQTRQKTRSLHVRTSSYRCCLARLAHHSAMETRKARLEKT
jgi:hypothetical protein